MNKIEELKKGCNKNFFVGISDFGVMEFQCGKYKRMPTESLYLKQLWCPECAEKIIQEQDNVIENLKFANCEKNEK